MKIRTSFVSNSSSSSFIANIDRLTKKEIKKLLDYEKSDENTDGWQINIDKERGLIVGSTLMDNGAFSAWALENGFIKLKFESWN